MKGERKMTIGKIAIAIALFLMLSAGMFATLPQVKAADITTYPFMTVVPGTVGVGQKLQVTMWLSMPPPTLLELGPTMTQVWHGVTVTVTKPDGTTQTLGPFNTESTGSTYTSYNPSEVGTYKFKLNFPGERKNGTVLMTMQPIDDYFKPSSTKEVTVTVQEEEIAAYPDWPLPTDYWTRPIDSENRRWSTISGNWLLERYASDGNLYIPYTTAPNN